MSAVLLTKRDTFLTGDQFNMLLYASGVSSSGSPLYNTNSGKKVSLVDSEDILRIPPPAIVKPQRLWTGKQVLVSPFHLSFSFGFFSLPGGGDYE